MKAGATLQGDEYFRKLVKQFPAKVGRRASKKGIAKAASRMRKYLRHAAPKRKGILRKAIGVRKAKQGYPIAWVGLGPVGKQTGKQAPYYYKRLEFDYGGRYAFFEKTVKSHQTEILEMIKRETIIALTEEAGKAYRKSKGAR